MRAVGVGGAFGLGPPVAFNQRSQAVVNGLGGHVVAEPAGRRVLPCAQVREVPPGDRCDRRVSEQGGVELRRQFRLLALNVDFVGVAEPMQGVLLTQRIYLDGLTRDSFLQRFTNIRNAVITVIWSIIQNLESVEPPSESVEPRTTH